MMRIKLFVCIILSVFSIQSELYADTTIRELSIEKTLSCDYDKWEESLYLPSGYNYCWHYKRDISKQGQSDSSANVIFGPPRDGIQVSWHVGPDGFPCPMFGRGAINHVWTVAGAEAGSTCPPKP